jgi:hypothetical protein
MRRGLVCVILGCHMLYSVLRTNVLLVGYYNRIKKVEDLVQIFSCFTGYFVNTKLILVCGPRYFGIWRERTRFCVDGEDGIG